ncbi:MAG: transporter substrate-binding domain-containing protein [Synergistaceae bacterium]|nr:transporter substrate-binding domain-containing protein [Synergistaceae bacterium]
MKRIFCAVAVTFVFAACAWADGMNVGVLSSLNMTEEQYRNFVIDGRNEVGWNFLSHDDENFRFYDSLLALQMALNAGEIEEVQLPEVVAEFFVRSNPSAYAVSCVTQVRPTSLAFGFLESNTAMRDKFNEGLKLLKESGRLEQLRQEYLNGLQEHAPVKLEKFEGAEKIKVALTGDLPPIDFVDIDGSPAGFNMAILAELGRALKLNVEVIDIDAGARSATLASRRADAVFWYKLTHDFEPQPDVPEGIILSDPYYEWNKFIHIRLKRK